MIGPDEILLNWLLALPFFAALCAAIFPRFALRPHSEAEAESLPRAPFALAALASLMGLSISAALLHSALAGPGAEVNYWWTSDLYQLRFRADSLAAAAALLIHALGFLISLQWYSLPTPTAPHRRAAFLLLALGGASAAILSADLIALLFFLQLTLVSAWLLAGVEAPGEADRMLKLTFAGGLLLTGGALLLWNQSVGTATSGLSLALLGTPPPALRLIGLTVLLGATPLLSAFPGHTWLPGLARPSPRTAWACGTLLALTGIAVALRLLPGVMVLPMAPGFARASLALGLLSLAGGLLGAWVGRSLRELIAWLTMVQAGQFLLALSVAADPTESASGPALTAAAWHLLAAPLALLALWSAMSAVLNRAGTDALPGLSGLLGKMPLAGIAFLAGGLSLAGVPPLPGFWEQRALLSGMLAGQSRVLLVLFVLADLLLLALVIGAFRRAFLRGEPAPPLTPPRRWEGVQLLLAAALVVALGALQGPLSKWTAGVVGNVLTLRP